MPSSVSILGVHQTDFASNLAKTGGDIADLTAEAVAATLTDAGIDAGTVESIHVGNAFGQLYTGQGHLGAMPATVEPDLWGVPAMRHEAACASSSMAALSAMAEIEAGRYDCVLVLGIEQEKTMPGGPAAAVQTAAAWVGHETEGIEFFWPYAFDRVAGEYDRRYGIDDVHLRAIGELNLRNAKDNPNAQTRMWRSPGVVRRRRSQPGRGRAAPPQRRHPDHRRCGRCRAGQRPLARRTRTSPQGGDRRVGAPHRRPPDRSEVRAQQ